MLRVDNIYRIWILAVGVFAPYTFTTGVVIHRASAVLAQNILVARERTPNVVNSLHHYHPLNALMSH